jgi:hypothetical protein
MEVTLKKNGWYNKLQSFVLGNAKPELYSLCPFFWLTIFCIFAVPFAVIIKGIGFLTKKILTDLEMKVEYVLNKYLSDLSLEDAVALEVGDKINKKKPFMLRKYSSYSLYMEWRDKMLAEHGDDFRFKYNEARSRYKQRMNEISKERENKRNAEFEKELKDAEKRQNRSRKLKNIWIPIVVWTQRVFNFILTLFLMTLITLFINFIVKHFNPSATLEGLKILGIIILVLGTVIGLVFLIRAYVLYLIENEIVPFWLKPFIVFFKYVGVKTITFFKWIGNGFSKFFGLFWEYFKANKNDYCPAINWDDEEK